MREYTPKKFRKNTDDEASIHEIFDDEVYNPKWFGLKADSIKNIIDVGGLIGSYSLWAYANYPKANIFTYEPSPDSYELLVENIKTLRAIDRIKPNNLAVWDKKSSIKLYRSGKKKTSGSSIIYKPNHHSEKKILTSFDIETISIDNVLNQIGGDVDILKLDCEGSEFDIIYSLDSEKLKSIKHIVLEYHNYDSKPTRSIELVKYMRNHGFLVQKSPGNDFLGYIYAKQIGINSDLVNSLIDELVEINEKKYTLLQNRKVVKVGLKLIGFLSFLKK